MKSKRKGQTEKALPLCLISLINAGLLFLLEIVYGNKYLSFEDWILIFFGSINLFLAGWFFNRAAYTAKTAGKVVDLAVAYSFNNRRGNYSTSYRISLTIEYEADGNRRRSRVSGSKDDFKHLGMGSVITIAYKPKRPEKIIVVHQLLYVQLCIIAVIELLFLTLYYVYI